MKHSYALLRPPEIIPEAPKYVCTPSYSRRTAVVPMVFMYLGEVPRYLSMRWKSILPNCSSNQLGPSFVTPELNLNVPIKMSQLKYFMKSYDLTNRYTWEKKFFVEALSCVPSLAFHTVSKLVMWNATTFHDVSQCHISLYPLQIDYMPSVTFCSLYCITSLCKSFIMFCYLPPDK